MDRMQETYAQRKRRYKITVALIYAAIVLLGVLSVWLMDSFIVAQKLEQERASVQRSLNSIRFRAERLIEVYSNMSRSLAVAQSFEGESEFQTLARLLRNNSPSVVNLARSQNYVITDVHPIEPNRDLLGYDYRDDPEQLKTVQEALDTDQTVIVGPIELLQGGLGLVLRTAQPGPGNAVGNIVLDFDKVLVEAGLESEPNVFLNSVRLKDDSETVIFGPASVWENNPVLAELLLGETVLELAKIPVGGWQVDGSHRFILILTTTGLVLIAIFGVSYARRLIVERADARRRLISAIEAIDDGFVIFDRHDRLLMCNTKFRELMDASESTVRPGVEFKTLLRGGLLRGHYPQAKGREEEWLAERLALHENPSGQTEIELSDGSWIKVSESKTSDGSTVGIRTDITELKKALHTAERAIKSKTEFINNMNHELRAPLSVMLGYLAFLRNVELFPQYKALLDAIGDDEKLKQSLGALSEVITLQATKSENSGKHLLELINSVLDWAKLNTGSVTLNLEMVRIDQVLVALGEEFQGTAEEKGLKLEVSATFVSIYGDPLRLRQVFTNLLSNALKFTESGGVKLSLLETGTSVEVTVEDTGKGIPQDQIKTIFDRFAQVNNSMRRDQIGTGLGLAIAKNLVELHGGRIEVHSALGQGSAFRVILERNYFSGTPDPEIREPV